MMRTRYSPSRCVMFLALILVPSARALAQDTASTHICSKALRIATIGHPEKKLDWALATLSGCGAEGADAAAHGFTSLSSERDTTVLDSLTAPLSGWRDVALLRTGMQIAENSGASPESRVFAIRYLYSLVVPGTTAGYADLTSATAHSCLGSYTTSGGINETRSVSSDYVDVLRTLGRRLANDVGTASPVRRAATCLELIRNGQQAPAAQSY